MLYLHLHLQGSCLCHSLFACDDGIPGSAFGALSGRWWFKTRFNTCSSMTWPHSPPCAEVPNASAKHSGAAVTYGLKCSSWVNMASVISTHQASSCTASNRSLQTGGCVLGKVCWGACMQMQH